MIFQNIAIDFPFVRKSFYFQDRITGQNHIEIENRPKKTNITVVRKLVWDVTETWVQISALPDLNQA